VENGAFYVTPREKLLESGCRLNGKIGSYEMPEETYFEIDEPSDWIIIEHLLKNKNDAVSDTRRSKIRLFATDCDGCLTDGGMYYSETGDELKKFNTKDGMGFALLRKAGIKTAIITGENTKIVENRAAKTKVDYLYQGITDKLTVLKEIAAKEGIDIKEIAYMGDDINDIEALQNCGLSFTVPNATPAARRAASVVVETPGGQGAVREAIEILLGY
jgi:N-acylneuraminate cytidylyltransferase